MPVLMCRFGGNAVRVNWKKKKIMVSDFIKELRNCTKKDSQIAEKFAMEKCTISLLILENDGKSCAWQPLEQNQEIDIAEATICRAGFPSTSLHPDDWYNNYDGDVTLEDAAIDEPMAQPNTEPQGHPDNEQGQTDTEPDEEEYNVEQELHQVEKEPASTTSKRKRQEKKLPKDFPLPKWSPMLTLEIKEGRLYMPVNKQLIKEEAVWHLVSIVGYDPPQGSYVRYAKRLLSHDKYKVLEDQGTDTPWTGLASRMSSYLRSQKIALNKRRALQMKEPQGASIAQPNPNDNKNSLEKLRKDYGIMNQNKALALLQKTHNLRSSMAHSSYKDTLEVEKYLTVPRFLQTEIDTSLNNLLDNEKREQNFDSCLEKLQNLFGGTSGEQTEARKISLFQEVHKAVQQAKYNSIKAEPISLKNVQHLAPVHLDLENVMPLSLRIFCNEGQLQHLYLCGQKEVIAQFPAMSARSAIYLLIGSYRVLNQVPPPAFEYFMDFLNYSMLNVNVPLISRYPKKSLMDFINNQYSLM